MGSNLAGHEFLIWGALGHALVLERTLADLGARVLALIDNDAAVKTSLPDLPLLHGLAGLDIFLATRSPKSPTLAALIAIGGGRGKDRREIATLLAARSIKLPSLVNSRAFVCNGVTLGEGSQVLAMASVAAGTRIGASCIINHGARVDHECVLGDGTHLAPSSTLCGLVETEMDVFVGAGAVILPRLRIGRGAIIGAGAVVTANVPPGTTVVGVPARQLQRNASLTSSQIDHH